MKSVVMKWLMVVSLLAACDDNDDDKSNQRTAKVNQIRDATINGQWRIANFVDSDNDETAHFNGYVFEFESDNTLTASNGSDNQFGTWSVTSDDNSQDDNSDEFDDIDFNLAFINPPDFAELSEDWEIISQSPDKIELRHVSGGNGGTDLLTFEKL